ncbi:MAG TPA: histidine kinase [Marmoricola sp.]|nr:histidine kinase [Marmoricola sp.]
MAPWRWRRPGHLASEADRATFRTLHTASLMTGALRTGLTVDSAERSVRHLRSLLAARAVALTDTERLLAWDGPSESHQQHAGPLARRGVADGGTTVRDHRDFFCGDVYCPVRAAVVSPLVVEDRVVGTLQVYATGAPAGLVRATSEVASWVSGQLELAELADSRARLVEAEVRALRAQISPHFIYNALNAIASFVRTDPDRARELLVDFADFTRYSFRRLGEYTTLEEELRSIERYLVLEQARFGDRLGVTLRIAPEVLPVTVPVLSLQPLVENAVRHGLADKPGGGMITILAEDHDREAVISIEDDGVGEDPERVRRALAGDTSMDSIGLGNVDERLRTVYGDDYGLVVETAPGAGTRVVVRVPKFAAGVRP